MTEQSDTHTPSSTQTEPLSPHSHTSQSRHDSSPITLGTGSSRTMGSKIVLRPVGDRFYPHEKVAKTIAKAIKSNFGEGYPSWKKVPENRRKMWFEEFKKTYTWAEADDVDIKKNFESRGSNKYITITKAVRKRKTQPLWMGDLAYAKLSAYWQTDKYKELCEKAMANRNINSGASMHTSGAKPHLSIWEEMKEENGGVAPSMDDFFMRTHKIQKGSNVGEWVSPQSQQIFDKYSKLKEEVFSNCMNETESMSQDDVTQHNNRPSDLAIFAQSVGGKKKGQIVGIGSLDKALDDNFLTPTQTARPDDPFIANMKNKMEDLEQENQQLRQQQKDLENETKQQLDENNAKMDIMSQRMSQILQHFDIKLP